MAVRRRKGEGAKRGRGERAVAEGLEGRVLLAGQVGFAPKVDYSVGIAISVAAGDFNGDGKADLAVANYAGGRVSVLMNKGNGSFWPKVDYFTVGSPTCVISPDLDSDGRPDLVVSSDRPSAVGVLLNGGDGTFAATADNGVPPYPLSLTSADFNADGKADLAATFYGSHAAGVLSNQGNGVLDAASLYPTGSYPRSITSADFDNDGRPDLAVGNNNGHTVSVLLNQGNGAFAAKVDYPSGSNPYSVVSADFNGDGSMDLALSSFAENGVSVLLNRGNGTFAPRTSYPTGVNPDSVVAADFNGDGMVDLAVADSMSNTVSILSNQGNGTFAPRVAYDTGKYPNSIASADFNGDGLPDLAVANHHSHTVSVLLNTSIPVEAGDDLVAAGELGTLPVGTTVTRSERIGNGSNGGRDVDLYRFAVAQASDVTIDIDAQRLGSPLDAYLRLFDGSGGAMTGNDDYDGPDSCLTVRLDPGTYYAGVSGYPNDSYNPNVPASGRASATAGPYRLTLRAAPVPTAGVELALFRISDASGVANTADPGVAKSVFQPGETVRVTLAASNGGTAALDAQAVLSIRGPDNETWLYDSHRRGADNSNRFPLGPGQTQYYSFDWPLLTSVPAGTFDILAALRGNPDWDVIHDDTQAGANTRSLGISAVLADRFTVGQTADYVFTVEGHLDRSAWEHMIAKGRDPVAQMIEALDTVNGTFNRLGDDGGKQLAGTYAFTLARVAPPYDNLATSGTALADGYTHPNYDYAVFWEAGLPAQGEKPTFYGPRRNIHWEHSFKSAGKDFPDGPFEDCWDRQLAHEFGHARGAIDLYGLSVGPARNPVNGTEYSYTEDNATQPRLAYPGYIMDERGEDTWDSHSAHVVDWAASATGRDVFAVLPLLHTYIFNRVTFHITDANGDDVDGATVRIYRCEWWTGNQTKSLDPNYDFKGTTDSEGLCSVAATGRNGLLGNGWYHLWTHLIEVRLGMQKYYAWRDVTDYNLAYWGGHTESWTIDIQTDFVAGRGSVWQAAAANATIQEFDVSAAEILAGEPVLLSVEAAAEVTDVEFYADLDGDGLAGDCEFIGGDSGAADGWSYRWDTRGWPSGTMALLAVAYAQDGTASEPASATLTIGAETYDHPPVVYSLETSALEVVIGSRMAIVAEAMDPDADDSVSEVLFYADANADGIPADAELIGSDTDASDGWSILWDTGGWQAGTIAVFAVARNQEGQRSSEVSQAIVLRPPVANTAPTVASVVTSASEADASFVTLLAMLNDDDPCDWIDRVMFYLDANGNGVPEPAELLAKDADPAGGWAVGWDTSEVPAGAVSLMVVAVDGRGAVSDPTVVEYVVRKPLTVAGDAADNAVYIRADDAELRVWLNGSGSGAPAHLAEIGLLSELRVSGLGGDDIVTVDLSGRGMLMNVGIDVDGGEGFDTVCLIGTSAADSLAVERGQLIVGSWRVSYSAAEALVLGSSTSTVLLGSLTLGPNIAIDIGDKMLVLSSGDLASTEFLIARKQLFSSQATEYTGLAAIRIGADIQVKRAWNGDANGDGVVNADDYFLIDSGFISQAKGWGNGDFNYDGVINSDDYFLIDSAFIGQDGVLGLFAVEELFSGAEVLGGRAE